MPSTALAADRPVEGVAGYEVGPLDSIEHRLGVGVIIGLGLVVVLGRVVGLIGEVSRGLPIVIVSKLGVPRDRFELPSPGPVVEGVVLTRPPTGAVGVMVIAPRALRLAATWAWPALVGADDGNPLMVGIHEDSTPSDPPEFLQNVSLWENVVTR